jgi:hypothetical protein
MSMLTKDDLRRHSRIDPLDRNPYDPCWLWQGAKATDGTPRIWTLDYERIEKRCMSGPKAVWNIAHGRGTGDKLTYRTCVNCDCVNPTHHALAADKAEIGAHIAKVGVRKGTALAQRRANIRIAHAANGIQPTPTEIVLAAREWTGTNMEFARLHGMCHTTVSRIRRGESHRLEAQLRASKEAA